MCCGGESRRGLWTKKTGSPKPTPVAVATMMMVAPLAPYYLCLQHRASFKTRLIALGAIHHRRAAAVSAVDDNAEKSSATPLRNARIKHSMLTRSVSI